MNNIFRFLEKITRPEYWVRKFPERHYPGCFMCNKTCCEQCEFN